MHKRIDCVKPFLCLAAYFYLATGNALGHMKRMDDIKQIREALGLTQAEMAERLGIHQATLSRIETGAIAPDKRNLLAAKALMAGQA